MYMGEFDTADDALNFYGMARTHNGAGVTIPSQVSQEVVLGYWLRNFHLSFAAMLD